MSEKSKEELRIGVYICHCGLNIAATVNPKSVAEYAKNLPNVVLSKEHKYMCSDPGQEMIKKDIKEQKLNRIIVAACSPTLNQPTYHKLLKESGIDPCFFEMVNIREQVSWVHTKSPEKATEKAKYLVKMAVAIAASLQPKKEPEIPVSKSVLVIGGGIAGMQAALDLADQDYNVTLVEKKPTLGGHMAQLDKTFPTLERSICLFGPKMVDVYKHPKIKLLVNSEVQNVSGSVGDFHVKVLKKARFVDEGKCDGCGWCALKCPINAPNKFDMDLGTRKAIYIPFPQGIPAKYTIDKEHCLYFIKGDCKVCEKVCETKAIDFKQEDQVVNLKVGAIIVATGYDTFDPSKQDVWGYKKYPNVVSSLDLERLISAFGPKEGKLVRPSDGKEPRSIAFIQCVGSRDKQVGNNYCSNTCCMTTLKQAVLLKEKHPECEINVFYIDIRAFGKGFEELYKRARSNFVAFQRGKVSEIVENKKNSNLLLRFEDTLSGEVMEKEFDMVVLAVGMVPPKGLAELASKLKIPRSTDGFLLESHPKLEPVNAPTEGIFLAGAIQGPKDIATTISQAKAAASSVVSMMSKRQIAETTLSTQKIQDLAKMPLVKDTALQSIKEQVLTKKSVLIIGGGIAGIQAALDLADQNYKVVLVEKSPILGGHMAQLDKTFPTMENSIFILDPKIVDVYKHPNVTLLVNSKVQDVSGSVGDFHVKVLKKARFVDEEKCDGCGICATNCSMNTPNEFDMGFGTRKAIYIPFPQGVPAKYTIDKEHCLHFTKGDCKACEEACKAKAIDFKQKEQVIEFDVGAIIVATGYDTFNPQKLKEWGYKKYPNVVSSLDLERLISAFGPKEGKLVRPSDGKEPRSIAFIQCVGSRDERAGNFYCSNTCCMTSIKQARQLKEKYPESEICIYYIDLRCFGKGYEEFYDQVQKEGVRFNKGIPSELTENPDTHNINLRSVDMVLVEMVEKEFDMVVLAVGMIPPKGLAELANKLKISRGADGFLLESHPKLKTMEATTAGIFLAGAVQGPKDIPTTVAQAKAAASSVALLLSKGKIKAESYIANVNEDKCVSYNLCELVCPYKDSRLK